MNRGTQAEDSTLIFWTFCSGGVYVTFSRVFDFGTKLSWSVARQQWDACHSVAGWAVLRQHAGQDSVDGRARLRAGSLLV
jgi:hypothetical protein